MSTFWSLWIIILTSTNLVLLFWILMANRKKAVKGEETKEAQTTGHVYDGIEEYDNALKMGFRLFANNCAICHGADGGGNPGFPNLTDKDWLYGGTPEKILETITHGRKAAMPAWVGVIGEESVVDVAEYVLQISGGEHDAAKAEKGAKVFAANCVACHGADGKGNQAVGAPNLTDKTWLYGGKPATIRQTIRDGRNGVMPAQQELLKEDRIHLLAAYVYSLSLEGSN